MQVVGGELGPSGEGLVTLPISSFPEVILTFNKPSCDCFEYSVVQLRSHWAMSS